MSDSFGHHGHQHARLPCPLQSPRACSNSCPLNQWCHPTISSSVIPFSSCLQSSPVSGSFQISPFFASCGQSVGVSASASVLPMNIQDWFPLEWTGWISLQSKGLSGVFFNTTVQNHQFFSAQLSSQSNSHIHIWILEQFLGIAYIRNYIPQIMINIEQLKFTILKKSICRFQIIELENFEYDMGRLSFLLHEMK